MAHTLPNPSPQGPASLANRGRSSRSVWPWILVGLIWTLVWGWVMVPYWIKFPVPDESTFLYGGWRLLHGQLPYRDFFTFLLPGSFWVVEALYRAVGVDLAVCRMVAMAVWLLSVGITAWLGRRYLTPWAMALLVAWFTLVHIPHHIEIQHHSLSALLGLLAVTAASLAVNNPQRSLIWASLSGLATGICALMTYSLAAILAIALGGWWWLWEARSAISAQALPTSRVRLWQAYTLAALMPIVVGVGMLLVQGVGADLWTNTMGWLLDGRYSQTTSHWFYLDGFTKLAGLTPYWLQHPGDLPRLTEWWFWALQGALPVLGLLWPVFYARDAWQRDRQPGGRAAHGVRVWMTTWAQRDWMLLLLGFSGLAFFVAVFSYPNSGLLAFHGWIPTLLAIIGLQNVAGRWGKLRWVGLGLAVVFTLGLTGDRLHESWMARTKPPVRSYGTVQPWVTTPDFAHEWSQALNALVTFLHQQAQAGRTVFIYNQAPQLYLLADRHNPTDQDLVMGVYNTPHQLCRVLTTLKLHPPALVVYDHLDQVDFTQDLRFADARHVDYRLRAIEAWLAKDYRIVAQAGPLVVWMRTPKSRP